MLALHAILAALLVLACAAALAMAAQGDDRSALWGKLAAGFFIANFALGSFIYPVYRVLVRRDYLDVHAPWAVNLFDIKEYLVLLGLPIAISLLFLARPPRKFQLFASIALLTLTLAAAVSAMIVTQVKSI